MSEMFQAMGQVDAQLLLWFNSFHAAYPDRFMMLFTGKWVWVPMYAAILWAMLRSFPWRRVVVYTLAVAVAITLCDQVCASLLRPVFCRLRPANLDNPLSQWVTVVDGYRGGRYGFPSCHAANSVALAVMVCLIFRRRAVCWFIASWALFTCLTRAYLGVHYPGDLVVGAAIGAVIGWGCYEAAACLCRRMGWPGSDKIDAVPILWAGLGTVACLLIAAF